MVILGVSSVTSAREIAGEEVRMAADPARRDAALDSDSRRVVDALSLMENAAVDDTRAARKHTKRRAMVVSLLWFWFMLPFWIECWCF